MTINCYTSIPSPYQEDLYRELSKMVDLKVIYEAPLPDHRRDIGWESRLSGYNYSFENRSTVLENIVLDPGSFHFFAGFPGGIKNAVRQALLPIANSFATQTEMPIPEERTNRWLIGAKVYAKYAARRGYSVFGIGEAARQFFRSLDIPTSLVFPFAYFAGVQQSKVPDFHGPIIFAGQLIHRKGIDLLLTAVANSRKARSRGLIIAGTGPRLDFLRNMVDDLGLHNVVHFMGAISSQRIGEYVADASCLVLPSRFDGWGVVVNEAIGKGVPVVVSDNCGSKELVVHGKCGYLFRCENTEELSATLENLLGSEIRWQNLSDQALRYYPTIAPSTGAAFLVDAIRYIRNKTNDRKPGAPWMSPSIHSSSD